jgi:beta-barrel assembly-enhancing protease
VKPVAAVFFDGETAHDRAVVVERVGAELHFKGVQTPLTRWPISGLHPIDPPSPGQPFRLTHDSQKGSRLVLRDQDFIAELLASNSALKGGYSLRHLGQVLGWTAGGLAAAAGLGWLAISFLPQETARLLPDSWRNRVGNQVVGSLVGNVKKCETPGATAAWSAMVGALAAGNADLPPVSISVYDIPITNAFAAPGGKIVFTRKLIAEAESPDEVAGILAHEVGHVAHLHPEAQMVRLTGVQMLLSAVSGGGGGEWAGNIAALAALFQYSRESEMEADEYARSTMVMASIDPTGLKHFFERVSKLEKGAGGAGQAQSTTEPTALEKLGSMFSTHPGTEDRIKNIEPLPTGQTPVKIMSEDQWKALKAVCG